MQDGIAQLAAIVNSSQDAILSTDLRGTIATWNPAAERMYSYTAAEAIGQPNTIIIPPDRLEEEAGIRRSIIAGQAVAHYESVRVRKDGVRIDVALTVSPVHGHDGAIIGLSKISRDISDLKQTNERQNQAFAAARRLAAIVESTDDAVIGMDLEGTITAWNLAAERMYGFTPSQAIGRSIRLVLPSDRQQDEAVVLDRIKAGETVEHFETVRCRRDGGCFPVSLTISPIRDETGAVVGASKIARDITERKRAAERAAFLAEAGAVLAASLEYVTTLKTVANLAVPSIADWCAVDVQNEERQLERLAVAHVDPTRIELARTIIDRYQDPYSPYSPHAVVKTGKGALLKQITDEMIVAAAKGDGERLRLVRSLGLRSYIIVPLTVHGRTFGALTLATAESQREYTDQDFQFAQDIAFRAALAVDNARAYDAAQAANRLKDEFLATLSHELRTPLNAILGYARLVRAGAMTPEREGRAIATIERNATALTQMIEDILDVSRIIAGKVRLNIQQVDLPHVVKESVEALVPAADAKHLRIQMTLDPRAGPISGDPDRLQQIVWNLVSNAVKFTPKNGVIQIRLERVNSHVEIAISDTGIGIASDFLSHIFERFRQGDSGPSRGHGGLGLGLAIVRHLVELHGGTIHAASDGKDRGSTFRIRLPLMTVQRVPASDRRTRSKPATSEEPPEMPRLDGVHVVAVDDDADARTLITEALEIAGARVTTVDSIAAALPKLEEIHPEVLIADIGLGGSDGYDLIARVRRSTDPSVRAVPAAALTAYARAEDRVRTLQSGFNMHLAKPIDPTELVVAVAALAMRKQPVPDAK